MINADSSKTEILQYIADLRQSCEDKISTLSALEFIVNCLPDDPAPAPRNPAHSHAATMDDITPGVQLLTVGYNTHSRVSEIEVAEVLPCYGYSESPWVRPVGGYVHSLVDMGVACYANDFTDEAWSKHYVTFLNTAENRRMVVGWLLSMGSHAAIGSAKELVERHQDDYSAEFVVSGQRVVACLK